MKLKIMLYNINHGFHTHYFEKEPNKFEEHRLVAAKKIVLEENPDILLLNEACFAEKNHTGILLNYKEIFNYPYFYNFSYGHEWGSVVLSKIPLEFEGIKLWDRSTIRSKFEIQTKIITIDLIHPSPTIPDVFKIEALREVLENKDPNYIIAGDFNTISDEDEYNEEEFLNASKKIHGEENAIRFWKGIKDRKLVKFIKMFGLRDLMKENKRIATYPTLGSGIDQKSKLRVDFMFGSQEIKVLDSYTIKNELSDVGSDHYPIVVIVDL